MDYTVQTSTSLTNWTSLAVIPGNASGFYSYTNFPSQDRLFYRAALGDIQPGAAGTEIVALEATPGDGTVVHANDGFSSVASYKLVSSGSDMALVSVTLHFDHRLWLYADTIIMKDDAGGAAAMATNLSNASFVEYSVGTDYAITISAANGYVLPDGGTNHFLVDIRFRMSSDRQSGPVALTSMKLTTVDRTGVIDVEIVPVSRTFNYMNP